jgi:hypothetical protein
MIAVPVGRGTTDGCLEDEMIALRLCYLLVPQEMGRLLRPKS